MSETNLDELKAPAWMDKEFFGKIIKISDGADAKIDSYEIAPGTEKDDHFDSSMYRATVKITKEDETITERFLVIKTLPSAAGGKLDLLKKSDVFRTEIRMYENVISRFEKAVNSTMAPKMFYTAIEPHAVIVLEDISKTGHRMINRWSMLDEIECSLTKLGEWHAASLIVVGEGDDTPKNFKYGLSALFDNGNSEYAKACFAMFTKIVSETEGYEELGLKIPKLREEILKRVNATFSNENSSISVLNHGDFHTKNLMYKRGENGGLEGVRMVDYKISIWASIAVDVLYALYAVCTADIRNEHRDELVGTYYDSFSKTLVNSAYKGKIPTLADVEEELKRHKHIEIFFLVIITPILHLMVSGEKSEFENIDNDEIAKAKAFYAFYSRQSLVEDIRKTLPTFKARGHFSDLE